MEERVKVSSMDIKAHINNLRKNPRFSEEMLKLVESDLEYGLSIDETEEYTSRRFDFEQMKVYSACLRKGYGAEVKECITKEGLTGEKMRTALEFYEKGVPLETVSEVLADSGQTAFGMNKLFRNILDKLQMADKETEHQGKYAKELLEQIKLIVEKIDFQESRYDALNDVLKGLQSEKLDEKVRNNMLEQLAEKDTLLEKQQNELNEARSAIARYRNELDKVSKEKEKLEKHMAEKEREYEKNKAAENISKTVDPHTIQNMGYKVAVMDDKGEIISYVPVEQVQKRKENHALTALFSRIAFKKKIDIVRLVAENGLEPKQLAQIRSAIEKGLSEEQLLVLINHQLPAEQMEEIIQIAVYENKQKGC